MRSAGPRLRRRQLHREPKREKSLPVILRKCLKVQELAGVFRGASQEARRGTEEHTNITARGTSDSGCPAQSRGQQNWLCPLRSDFLWCLRGFGCLGLSDVTSRLSSSQWLEATPGTPTF